MLAITSVPVVIAGEVVTKRTITLLEAPGETVNGMAGEVTEKLADVVMELTIRIPPLPFRTVNTMSFGWLKIAVPKFSDAGSTEMDGTGAAPAVPVRLTKAGELGSLLAIVSVALAAPATDGA